MPKKSQKRRYGAPPLAVLDPVKLKAEEFCYVQYLPVKMAKIENIPEYYAPIQLPVGLEWTRPLVELAYKEYGGKDDDKYIYVTAKHFYVSGGCYGNRPGWHSDGFGTDDINIIWSNKFPTEFCLQNFSITEDHDLSLKEMEEQVIDDNIVTYPKQSILVLDKYVIHRTPEKQEGLRTFVKISISKDRYNLEGNARNEMFENCTSFTKWKMNKRKASRNHTVGEK